MLWIISGPTSVGKSTFIESKQFPALTGFRPKKKLLIKPMDVPATDPRLVADANCIVHYNMLRPVSLFARNEATEATSEREYQTRSVQFSADPWWNEFSRRTKDKPKRAVILVAGTTLIWERAGGRRGYNIVYWRSLYEKLNFPDIYRAWSLELERHNIPFMFMNATGSNYPILDPATAFAIANSKTLQSGPPEKGKVVEN